MQRALALDEARRTAPKTDRRAPAQIGERLSWPRAALFVLGLSAALWLGIALLLSHLLG